MLSPEELESVLNKRLLSKETVFLGTSLSKVSSKFQDFVKSLESQESKEKGENETDDRIQLACDSVLKELELYALEMKKGSLIGETYTEEIEEYKAQEGKIEAETIRIQQEIDELKSELQQEKEVRKRKEEYEALAKKINSHLPKSQTQKEAAAMEQKMEQLGQESSRLNDVLEMRSKQFSVLMASVKDLQSLVEEEKQDEQLEITKHTDDSSSAAPQAMDVDT